MSIIIEQKPLADFIKEQKITLRFDYADSNPNMPDSQNMDHYRVTLRNADRKRMTLVYSKGYGHNNKPPEVDEVLDCVASDAAGFENSNGFEDWCSEYGYDTDSRSAERTYKAIEKQAAKLQAFLGTEAFNELLWNVERM